MKGTRKTYQKLLSENKARNGKRVRLDRVAADLRHSRDGLRVKIKRQSDKLKIKMGN